MAELKTKRTDASIQKFLKSVVDNVILAVIFMAVLRTVDEIWFTVIELIQGKIPELPNVYLAYP